MQNNTHVCFKDELQKPTIKLAFIAYINNQLRVEHVIFFLLYRKKKKYMKKKVHNNLKKRTLLFLYTRKKMTWKKNGQTLNFNNNNKDHKVLYIVSQTMSVMSLCFQVPLHFFFCCTLL